MSAARWPPNWLALEGAANARVVVPGVLVRSDNLQGLTERDVRLLIEQQGVEVIVDLRTEAEVTLEGPGPMVAERAVRIEHRSLFARPADGATLQDGTVDLSGPGVEIGWRDESPVVRSYMGFLSTRPDSIVGAIRTIARADGATLVHCAAGKDRTGVVVALALEAAGVERDAIAADYLATAERIETILARLVSSPTYRAELENAPPAAHTPVAGTIERVLELVDASFGGAVRWLTINGLGEADHRRLRRRLRLAGALRTSRAR